MCTAVESIRARAQAAAAQADKAGVLCVMSVTGDDVMQRRRHVR